MTVCGIKQADGVCVMGECPHIKRCCPVVWDKSGEPMTKEIKIRCDDCKFVEDCVDYGWQDCRKFTQKPSEPMTNERWFASLSTEEKAKTIVCLEVNALHKWKKGLVKSDVDEIKRWLKEKRK